MNNTIAAKTSYRVRQSELLIGISNYCSVHGKTKGTVPQRFCTRMRNLVLIEFTYNYPRKKIANSEGGKNWKNEKRDIVVTCKNRRIWVCLQKSWRWRNRISEREIEKVMGIDHRSKEFLLLQLHFLLLRSLSLSLSLLLLYDWGKYWILICFNIFDLFYFIYTNVRE